jgi:hypothetical protein
MPNYITNFNSNHHSPYSRLRMIIIFGAIFFFFQFILICPLFSFEQQSKMRYRPLPFGWKAVIISLLVPFLLATKICAAQMDLPPPSRSDFLQDHPASDHHSRHHSLLMGPCLDRGKSNGESPTCRRANLIRL